MLKTKVDGQLIEHNGIKVSLLGMVLQLPTGRATLTSEDFVTKLDPARSKITVSNISHYR